MDYGALIPLAAFFAAIQLTMRTNAHPLLSASVAVIIPYAVSLVVKSIVGFALFSIASVLTVLIQFVLSVYVFKKVRDENSVLSTFAWGVGGFIVIVIAIPYYIGLVFF